MSEQTLATQTQDNDTKSPTGKPPVITHWNEGVFAKVWENTSAKGGTYFNVTSGRLYSDRETGETRETNNLQKADLPKMQYVMGEAYRSISLLQQNIKLENSAEPQKQDWLEAPKRVEKELTTAENDSPSQIENGRAQSPEM